MNHRRGGIAIRYRPSNQGVPIWGLLVQNEPEAVQSWESCIYTAAEERDFARDPLGPALVLNRSDEKGPVALIVHGARAVVECLTHSIATYVAEPG